MNERLVQPSELNQEQINVLAVSAVRALVRKGLIERSDLTVEISQQGVPAEWAYLLFRYISQMPAPAEGDLNF